MPLFHGPPGTGKTYTCQYLFRQMQDCTRFVVVGESLTRMHDICVLARRLQPSMVLFELLPGEDRD